MVGAREERRTAVLRTIARLPAAAPRVVFGIRCAWRRRTQGDPSRDGSGDIGSLAVPGRRAVRERRPDIRRLDTSTRAKCYPPSLASTIPRCVAARTVSLIRRVWKHTNSSQERAGCCGKGLCSDSFAKQQVDRIPFAIFVFSFNTNFGHVFVTLSARLNDTGSHCGIRRREKFIFCCG